MLAGSIQARPTAAGSEISRRRSSGGGAPLWSARVARWWSESAPMTKTPNGLKMGRNDLVRGPRFFWIFLSDFGVGSSLGTQI